MTFLSWCRQGHEILQFLCKSQPIIDLVQDDAFLCPALVRIPQSVRSRLDEAFQ
jgi:hypothetical protein